jgi:hypothetical protein
LLSNGSFIIRVTSRAIRDALVEKIWEGTTTVLSLDLVRAANTSALDAFISVRVLVGVGYFLSGLFLKNLFCQWAQGIMSSCPLSLQIQAKEPLSLLTPALTELSMAYTLPIPTLLPRPALFLFGYTASSLYLLEHAIWSHTNGEAERETDIEVFTRWVAEGGLTGAVGDVRRVRGCGIGRVKTNLEIVYGTSGKPRL